MRINISAKNDKVLAGIQLLEKVRRKLREIMNILIEKSPYFIYGWS